MYINVTCIKTNVFHLLFKDISMAHADEEERTIAESRQGKIQGHQHTQPKRHHSLTHFSCCCGGIFVENNMNLLYDYAHGPRVCLRRYVVLPFCDKMGFAQSCSFSKLLIVFLDTIFIGTFNLKLSY